MSYLSVKELAALNFKAIGDNVKISRDAKIYEPEKMVIGSNVRIDDFSMLSGRVTIGSYSHVTPMCLVAGGDPGVILEDFVTLAYGVKVFSQTDDYSGESMTNSMISKSYKNELFSKVVIGELSIIGTNSVVMPGVEVGKGVAIGACSLVNRSLDSWGIYVGSPAKFLKKRSQNVLSVSQKFLQDNGEL